MADLQYEPTDAELEILHAIWELQPVPVRAVHERVSLKKGVGYTTVLKQIQRLMEKGVLEKTIEEGVHYYSSRQAAADTKKILAQKVLHTAFGGSITSLLEHALDQGMSPAPGELAALKTWLDRQTGV